MVKSTTEQAMIYKRLHREQKIEPHEPHQKPRVKDQRLIDLESFFCLGKLN